MSDDDVTPANGIPLYDMDLEYQSPDTARIVTNESSTAIRIDNAYVSGFNEGFIHGKIKILEIAHEILIRAGNSLEDATNITKVIAKHAAISDAYNTWLLSHKNNY